MVVVAASQGTHRDPSGAKERRGGDGLLVRVVWSPCTGRRGFLRPPVSGIPRPVGTHALALCDAEAVREKLGELADTMGVRTTLARGRDRLVDLLDGERSEPFLRRNRIDDANLRLLLSFNLRPDSNCLDVGAHDGIFLRDIQRVAPHGHHIAYEPVPSQCANLRRQFPDVDMRQRALSNEDGQGHLCPRARSLTGRVIAASPEVGCVVM